MEALFIISEYHGNIEIVDGWPGPSCVRRTDQWIKRPDGSVKRLPDEEWHVGSYISLIKDARAVMSAAEWCGRDV